MPEHRRFGPEWVPERDQNGPFLALSGPYSQGRNKHRFGQFWSVLTRMTRMARIHCFWSIRCLFSPWPSDVSLARHVYTHYTPGTPPLTRSRTLRLCWATPYAVPLAKTAKLALAA